MGASHASNLVQYKEFKIENWQPDAGYTNQGKANLSVKLFKLGDVIGVRDIEQKIGLSMKLDASNNISECFSVGTNANGFWLASPTNLGDIYFAGGNVGIGTTSPGYNLDVLGGLRATTGLNTNNDSVFSFGSGTTWIQGSSTTNALRLFTNGGERVRVDTTGNVGIGTTTPGYPLDVRNNLGGINTIVGKFTSNTVNGACVTINDLGTTISSGICSVGDDMTVFTHNTEKFRVKSDGKVGIGTTAPATKLDVAGGVKIGVEYTCDGGTEGTLRYNSGTKQMEFCNGSSWTSMGGEARTGVLYWNGEGLGDEANYSCDTCLFLFRSILYSTEFPNTD